MTLTPEADAEVRRNLWLVLGLTTGFLLLLLVLLAVTINPSGGTEGFQVASLMLGAFLLPLMAMTGAGLTIAYPMGCWPGFLRARRLADLYGIDPEALSNPRLRRWMKTTAYWSSFAKGAGVGLGFVAPWILITWAVRGKGFPEGLFFPALMMVIYAGGLASKAWVVRRLVLEKEGS